MRSVLIPQLLRGGASLPRQGPHITDGGEGRQQGYWCEQQGQEHREEGLVPKPPESPELGRNAGVGHLGALGASRPLPGQEQPDTDLHGGRWPPPAPQERRGDSDKGKPQ